MPKDDSEIPKNLEGVIVAPKEALPEIVDNVGSKIVSDEALAELTFEQAWELLEKHDLESIDEYAPALEVLSNRAKDRLVDVPFLAIDWRFSKGEFGDFVILRVMTEDSKKFIITDGSTGLCKQLDDITLARINKGHKYPQAAMQFPRGLRRSSYKFDPETGKAHKGEDKPGLTTAHTYFIG